MFLRISHFCKIWILLSTIQTTTVSADTLAINPWLEMADVCETVISQQSQSILRQYAPAPKQLNVEGLHEISVHHSTAALIMAAGYVDSKWFLCVVKADYLVNAKDINYLIKAWTTAQHEKINLPEYRSVIIDDGYTIGPARVLCHENGSLSVVFGFSPSENEFRIGAMNRIPSSVPNPCEIAGISSRLLWSSHLASYAQKLVTAVIRRRFELA